MKAWLITWEWFGNHAAVDEKVVDILSARRSAEWVREYLGRLYAVHHSSPTEMMRCAAYSNPESPRYPARYVHIADGKISYAGRIHCGDNPYLFARLVNNLEIDQDGRIDWDEIPVPAVPDSIL